MKNLPKKLLTCPNCEFPLLNEENFCPQCGQKNQDILLPLSSHLGDAFEAIFNWDSRVLRTLKMMFFRPGELTRQFNQGKRASYVLPLRMYLISSLLFFLLYSLNSKSAVQKTNQAFENMVTNDRDTLRLNMGTFNLSMTNDELVAARDFDVAQIDTFLLSKKIEPTFINKLSFQQTIRAVDDVGVFFNQLTQVASIGMFFLMPIFALLLMFLFSRQKFYVEHLVASVHIHTLVFLLISLNMLCETLFPFYFPYGILWLVVVLLIIFSLKKIYDKSWWATFGRSLILAMLYFIILALSLFLGGMISLLSF